MDGRKGNMIVLEVMMEEEKEKGISRRTHKVSSAEISKAFLMQNFGLGTLRYRGHLPPQNCSQLKLMSDHPNSTQGG